MPLDDLTPTIDDLVRALRTPAQPEELRGEAAAVTAILTEVAGIPIEEPAPMPARTRTAKLAVLAGAFVLSAAGVAAAAVAVGPSKLDPVRRPVEASSTTADLSATSRTSETVAADTTVAASTVPDTTPSDTSVPDTTVLDTNVPVPDPGAAVSIPPCPSDVANHGDYVSSVAHDTPPGPEHGQIVSAAAQSDCGKPASDQGDDGDSDDGDAATPGGSERGHERANQAGNTNSHANGNGKSSDAGAKHSNGSNQGAGGPPTGQGRGG